MPVDEARRKVELEGLRFVIQEERYEPGVEKGIVLEQSPQSGERAPADTEVAVVVSGLGRELTMPNVVGYPLEMILMGLESDGLRVVSDTVWSPQPVGMVIAQTPEQGATLHAGDTVTLTVSGGLDVPISLEVNLANLILLKSAELRQATFRPGEVLAVVLHLQALRSTAAGYVVFVHLIAPDGSLVAQQDVEPIVPTATWRSGMEIVDPHQIVLPANLPPGRYQLRTGMYPQGEPGFRLPVVDAGLTSVEADSILIAEVEIR